MKQQVKDAKDRKIAAIADYKNAVAMKADRWVAACGGKEDPFGFNGIMWLYVFNPDQGQHGYLNMSTDIVNENYK